MERYTALGLFLTLTVLTVNAAVPLINAPWGKVQGISVEGDEGRMMNTYRAIPYAVPPVGKLRFEKPQPHPGPGEGNVFVADQVMLACPQIKYLIGESRKVSEDCLKLDVYVPAADGDSDRPYAVMVFIHGGGFSVGDAYTYRPSRMVVDGRVIVVVIQYRLGPFGFFSSGDDTVRGNQGLWDQSLALRWVKDNIPSFGGDPTRITIFGESAGSMSVGLQMMSPESRGLFQRGILQSGAPQSVARMSEAFDRTVVFRELANLFECPGEATVDWLNCLKEQPEEEFFNKTMQHAASSPLTTYFFPLVDGEFIPRDLVELSQDEQYMKENGIDKIDTIIGMNNKEGALVLLYAIFMGGQMDTLYTADMFRGLMEQCLSLKQLKKNAVLKKTIEFYYRGAEAGLNVSENLDALVDMYGDCLLIADIVAWARILADSCHTGARHMYVFDHDFAFNKGLHIPGSHHGDEIILEFDNSIDLPDDFIFKTLNKSEMAPEEFPLADKFLQILTSFAKTGNPNPPLKDDLGGADWPTFTREDESYLSLSLNPRVVPNLRPYKDRAALWLDLLPELSRLTAGLPEETVQPPPHPARDNSAPREEL